MDDDYEKMREANDRLAHLVFPDGVVDKSTSTFASPLTRSRSDEGETRVTEIAPVLDNELVVSLLKDVVESLARIEALLREKRSHE